MVSNLGLRKFRQACSGTCTRPWPAGDKRCYDWYTVGGWHTLSFFSFLWLGKGQYSAFRFATTLKSFLRLFIFVEQDYPWGICSLLLRLLRHCLPLHWREKDHGTPIPPPHLLYPSSIFARHLYLCSPHDLCRSRRIMAKRSLWGIASSSSPSSFPRSPHPISTCIP